MNGVARYFMMLMVLWVVIGMIWGIQMSATHNHTLSPAHAHLNLVGWVGFAIFAFFYPLVPGADDGMWRRFARAVWHAQARATNWVTPIGAASGHDGNRVTPKTRRAPHRRIRRPVPC